MGKSPKSPEVRERLAAALRENLKKRKAKTREMAAKAPEAPESAAAAIQHPETSD